MRGSDTEYDSNSNVVKNYKLLTIWKTNVREKRRKLLFVSPCRVISREQARKYVQYQWRIKVIILVLLTSYFPSHLSSCSRISCVNLMNIFWWLCTCHFIQWRIKTKGTHHSTWFRTLVKWKYEHFHRNSLCEN